MVGEMSSSKAPPPVTRDSSRGFKRPNRLGRWEVVAKIAGGGMSAIYLGRRVEPPAFEGDPTMVALKIMRHDVRNDARVLKMFLDEGRLLKLLVHPNVVRTLDVIAGEDQGFIAMELLLGTTFAAIQDACVGRGLRLNAGLAAWASARIADALHYAHELRDDSGTHLSIIHRDVNPQNVFATFSGEVKLFDFGMAKVEGGAQSSPNLVVGKVPYLAPEQIMQLPLDRRSDVFALGITFWELLTAKRLFRRDTDAETLRAVHMGPIPDPREIAPEVPAELARIAKRALERNRTHRYATTAEFGAELDRYLRTQLGPDSVGAMPGRLSQLVETLYPDEQKRQNGWLKPVIVPTPSVPPVRISSPPSGAPPSARSPFGPSSRPPASIPGGAPPSVPPISSNPPPRVPTIGVPPGPPSTPPTSGPPSSNPPPSLPPTSVPRVPVPRPKPRG